MTAAATGRRHGALVLLLSLGLAGCATSAIELAPERPDRPWVPATADNGEIVPGKAGTAPSAGAYVLPPQRGLGYVPPAAAIDTRKTYRLGELIDIAESSNPTTRIAWNEARRAALAAGIAESTFLPRISAGAIGGIQTSNGSASALGREAGSNETLSGSVSAVSLEWLLFDFGQRAAVVDAAKQLSLISNFGFTAAHQQVIYDVSLAFYGHAAARSRVAAAKQSLKNAESVQAAVEDRYRHQIGTVTEVANVRQLTAQARLVVVQASGSVEDSYLALVTAMGISPLTRMKIADISGRRLSPAMAAPVQSVISAALARRPDIQSAYAAQKASLANVRVAEADFLPKVFVSGNGTYNSGSLTVSALPAVGQLPPTVNINGNRLGGTFLAGVSVPLYDGGMRLAKLAQAQAEVDNADARMAKLRNDAVRQIVVADNALRTGLSTYAASQALTTAAQTSFDASLAAYRDGIGSITELTLAQTQLLQAKNASTDAYSLSLSAAATLALSMGALGTTPRS